MGFGFLAPLTVAALTLLTSISGGPMDPGPRVPVRTVDVRGAASMVARGAVVLDARDPAAFARGHLPGAQAYAWQRMTGTGAQRGRIRADLQSIADAFAVLGVDGSRPVLVYGAADAGWGEEGHAAWLLALLGHPDVGVLDGGFHTWRAAGRPVVTATTVVRPTGWIVRPREELRASAEHVRVARQVLDVRTAVEFGGATPFGEARGGHVPGAVHLDWRSVLDENGRVLSATRLNRALVDVGVDPREEIIACCSSGVRSAFVTVALLSRGVTRVRNYDGSMIEWASDPASPVAR